MVDMTVITGALTALKGARDITGAMLELRDAEMMRAKVIDLQSAILTAQSAAIDAKTALSDAADSERELKRRIEELEAALAFKGKLIQVEGHSYEAIDGKPAGSAFCPICMTKGKFHRMPMIVGGGYQCQACKAQYRDATSYLWPEKT